MSPDTTVHDPTVRDESVVDEPAAAEEAPATAEPADAEVLRPGYRCRGRLVRPAMVRVGRPTGAPEG